VFRTLVIAPALAIAWLIVGRQLALLLDRVIAVRVASMPVKSLRCDGGGFVIGEFSMTFGATNNLRSNLTLHSDALNRVVLASGDASFILGPRTNPVDPSGRPEIDFVPETGDEVSFTAERSVIGWPTPFEFNFMMRTPWWKRYVYYRLVWSKRSGAKLTMRWLYEQDYYMPGGWTAPAMMWNGQTGMLRTEIHPAASRP